MPTIIDEWYEEHGREVSHNTDKVYGYAVRRIKEAFTGYAGDYKPLDVKRYMTDFESRGYSHDSAQIELSVLKQVFAHAVLRGDVDTSPATEVHVSRGLQRKKRNALTEEQEIAVANYRGEDWLFGYMLLYTGARRGELLALDWQDIDRRRGVICFDKKLNYGYGNTPKLEPFMKSKNGKREAPLLAPLAAVLPRNHIGKVFTGKDGNYMTAAELGRRWKQYCRNIGFVEIVTTDDGKTKETFPVSPHCFRHSFVTLCFEAGIDAKTTAAFIGDTEAVTRDVYTDLRNSHHATSAERVNAYLELRNADRAEAR